MKIDAEEEVRAVAIMHMLLAFKESYGLKATVAVCVSVLHVFARMIPESEETHEKIPSVD